MIATTTAVQHNAAVHAVGVEPGLIEKHPFYTLPSKMTVIPMKELDARSDQEIDQVIANPPPVSSEKNVWFFWDKGYAAAYPYAKRTVRTWVRRLSPHGWTIRVVDLTQGASDISKFLDVNDPNLFPKAFAERRIDGPHSGQMVSDLVRFPLLLIHGGIYADITTLQVGDIEKLCNKTIFDPTSRYELIVYNGGNESVPHCLFNFFMAARPGNEYVRHVQELLMALWSSDGGRTRITGLNKHPLIKEPARFNVTPDMLKLTDDGATFEEWREDLYDYGVQMLAMNQVLGTVDEKLGWNGPEYAAKHVYALDTTKHALRTEMLTFFNGNRAFQLFSLPLPKEGEVETADQKAARELVEDLLNTSFCIKLNHGFTKIWGDTLGILWRNNEGSDIVFGTYAHWLRYSLLHWTQAELPAPLAFDVQKPLKVGSLLG